MSFIGPTEIRNIKAPHGKQYRLFLTEQEGRHYAASILYFDSDGALQSKIVAGLTREDTYAAALQWIGHYIPGAVVEPL